MGRRRRQAKATTGGSTVTPRKTGKKKADPRFNTALARGLDILRSFRQGEAYLGNADLAERTGVPKATVSRLTFTLAELGYLKYKDLLPVAKLFNFTYRDRAVQDAGRK